MARSGVSRQYFHRQRMIGNPAIQLIRHSTEYPIPSPNVPLFLLPNSRRPSQSRPIHSAPTNLRTTIPTLTTLSPSRLIPLPRLTRSHFSHALPTSPLLLLCQRQRESLSQVVPLAPPPATVSVTTLPIVVCVTCCVVRATASSV